jgi:hypothetical protein
VRKEGALKISSGMMGWEVYRFSQIRKAPKSMMDMIKRAIS